MVGGVLFGVFAILLILGIPIAICVGVAAMIALLVSGDVSMSVVVQRMYSASDSFPMMAIPFFIVAGSIMERGGLSKRLINFASSFVGHMTGGLGLVTVVTSMFFAAISGSGPATTAAVGGMMIPAMEENNYDRKFATSLTATAGALGPLIPPSVLFVTFGVATGVSIGALFMSGVIPGLLIGVALCVTVYIISKKHGFVGTNVRFSWKNVWTATKDAIWVIFMPLIVLGGIYGGIFTPTEAAVVAAVYGLVLGFFVYKELKIKDLPKIFVDSALTSALVMFVIACAQCFSWVMSNYHVTNAIAAGVMAITSNKVLLLLLLNVMLLISGCFIELNASIVIFAPMLLPIMQSIGVDPIHFGCFMVANLCLGLVTPPLGVNLYVACGLMKIKIEDTVRWLIPLLGICVAVVLLVTFCEPLALFIPRLLGLL